MIDLSNIKTILQVAGINRLQLQFDNDHDLVNVDYVFKGKPGARQIAYKEIIENLTIGHQGPPVSAQPAPDRELE